MSYVVTMRQAGRRGAAVVFVSFQERWIQVVNLEVLQFALVVIFSQNQIYRTNLSCHAGPSLN